MLLSLNIQEATWLCQPLVSCLCETPRLAERFILFMLHFQGTKGDAPLIRPVPFLPERFVKQASAALCLQAAWRAHRGGLSASNQKHFEEQFKEQKK